MKAVGPSVIGLLVIGVALVGAALMAAGCDPVPPPSMVPHLEPTIAPSAPPVDVATLRTLSPTVGPSAVAQVEDKPAPTRLPTPDIESTVQAIVSQRLDALAQATPSN